MQLGELQSQLGRFSARGVRIVALSVDPPMHSEAMIRRLGLTFAIASDEQQIVQKAFGVQNPETKQLALHAVFVIDETMQVIYRKIAGRRPLSQELLDAVDYYHGKYPMSDSENTYAGTPVAFPQNNFQALIEAATSSHLPKTMDRERLHAVVRMIKERQLDEATIAYRQYIGGVAAQHSRLELIATAVWVASAAVSLTEDARLAGAALNQALLDQAMLRSGEHLDVKALELSQKHLDTVRSLIRNNAHVWNLAALKTTLRGYRELSLAAKRAVSP